MPNRKHRLNSENENMARLIILLSALILIGCGAIRPPPMNSTLFHSSELKPVPQRVNFDGVWYANRMDFAKRKSSYKNIFIKPVNVYPAVESFQKQETDDEVLENRWEEYNEVARYAYLQFRNAITNFPNHPLKVVDEIGSDTLVMELALIEIKPIDPLYNAAASIGSFFIPGGGLVKVLNTSGATLEGQLWDATTGEELVEFRDRKTQKISPLSIRDYQQYGHVREAIDDWAESNAELLATPEDKKVTGRFFVRLSPF